MVQGPIYLIIYNHNVLDETHIIETIKTVKIRHKT